MISRLHYCVNEDAKIDVLYYVKLSMINETLYEIDHHLIDTLHYCNCFIIGVLSCVNCLYKLYLNLDLKMKRETP